MQKANRTISHDKNKSDLSAMRSLILIKYGELWLKSEPVRRHFEKILKENIKRHLKENGINARVRTSNGRFFLHSEDSISRFSFLGRTFGIVSYASALETNKDMEEIKQAAEAFAKPQFKIKARRTDKSFPLSSQELQREIGMHLEKKGIPADLQNPKHIIKIEIRDNAYIYAKEQKGPGGLPLGTGSVALARLRDNNDLMAAWLVMKRGTNCIFIKPKKSLLKTIEKWSVGRKIRKASLKEAKKHAKVLVDCRKSSAKGFVILNPLAGFSAKEKKSLMKRIGKKI